MKRMYGFLMAILLLGATIVPCTVGQEIEGAKLPIPAAPFEYEISKTFEDSKQDYSQPVTPPRRAPNVVLILTDNLGLRSAIKNIQRADSYTAVAVY